jgi:hypothetical protein
MIVFTLPVASRQTVVQSCMLGNGSDSDVNVRHW